jgi:glutaredoxin-like YruB-family protein
MDVIVYSTSTCPWCKKTKEWLEENKVKFKDIDVTQNAKARDEMIDKSGQMGVPVVMIGDEILVGFNPDKMKNLLKL